MTRVGLAAFFMLLNASTNASADYYNAADALIDAFSPSCSNSGEVLSNALAQASNLQNIVKSIKDDPNCQGFYTTLIQDMNTRMSTQAGLNGAPAQTNRQNLPGYVEDLQAEILNEQAKGPRADPAYVQSLNTELQARKIELVKNKYDIDYQRNQRSVWAATTLYNQASLTMKGLASNAECAGKYPNIVAQIGAQIMMFSSQFATDLVGATMLATGGIIDQFVKMYRDYDFAKTIKGITDEKFGVGIGCALEGMAGTYCRSRDLMRVANANKLLQEEVGSCQNVASPFAGVSLVGRDMTNFVAWVQGLYQGSQATSPAHATEKMAATGLRASLKQLQDRLDGEIFKTNKDLDRSGGYDPKDPAKVDKVIGLVKKLEVALLSNINSITQGNGYVSSNTGPLGDIFARDPRCGALTFFYSHGTDRVCATKSTTDSCETCVREKYFGGKDLIPPTIDQINASLFLLYGEGLKYVSDQDSLVNSNDPQLALSSAGAVREDGRKASQFLSNTKTYLESLLNNPDQKSVFHSGSLRTITQQALQHINDTIKRMNNPTMKKKADGTEEPDALADTTYFSQLLAPLGDVYYVPREISFIVRADINDKVEHQKIDPGLALLIRSTTTDSVNEFTKNYTDLEKIRRQVNSASGVIKGSLQTMWKAFDDQIVERLKRLSKSKNQNDKEALQMFCIQTLLLPAAPNLRLHDNIGSQIPLLGPLWDRNVNINDYCKGLKYKSMYTNSQLDLDYDTLSKQPFEQRACVLYDFYRKTKLEGLKLKSSETK